MLALLGFRVRCVCYSEYLSERDYNLFEQIFQLFEVAQYIKYSKITELSEDTIAAKGDIRGLTQQLIMQQNSDVLCDSNVGDNSAVCKEAIMLVDEVDVFFGEEFYGQTYNQVTSLQDPNIYKILADI